MLGTFGLEATSPITTAYARSICGVRAPLLKRRRFGGLFDKNKPSKGSDEGEHTTVADRRRCPPANLISMRFQTTCAAGAGPASATLCTGRNSYSDGEDTVSACSGA